MKINLKFTEIKEKICVFYKKNKKVFFSFIICFIILIALVISTFVDLFSKPEDSSIEETNSVTSYAGEIETKLVNMISKLESISSVSVFVMVDATPTIVYLTETSEKNETDENGSVSESSTTVVFEKDGSSSSPVVVSTIMPKVTGVLIVTNSISASTKLSILNSVSIVLNIDQSCISLLQES